MPRGGLIGIKLSHNLTRAGKRSKTAVDRAIKKEVIQRLNLLWTRATAAFVTAVSRNVLIDTGMSLASVYPLATKVQKGAEIRRIIASNRKRNRRRGSHDMSGLYNPHIPSTRTLGERLGQDAYRFKLLTTSRGTLDFGFEIKVWQFYLHEEGYGNASPMGGMKALVAGRVAFENYINLQFRRAVAPDIQDLTIQELFLKQSAGGAPRWLEE